MNLIKDLLNIFSYIFKFLTDPKLERLRIFILWGAIAFLPSISIYIIINTWQIHIPGVEVAITKNNPLWNMMLGTSILPILFFFTKGLRGYHIIFNNCLEFIFNKFERKSIEELEEEYGETGLNKLKKVNIGRYVAAFIVLELLILIWAIISYFILGSNITGLSLLGSIADELLLEVIVFGLEGIYCIFDAVVEIPSVYKLRLKES